MLNVRIRTLGKDDDRAVTADNGFARPVNRMAFNAATEESLAKYLGGRFEPPNGDETKLLASIKQ